MPSQEALQEHVIELSNADNWFQARSEWFLDRIYINEALQHCPCGQTIKEVCVIQNRLNGRSTEVGNHCVHNFMGIESKSLFDSLRRVISGQSASYSEEVILYAHRHRLISDWDMKFYLDIRSKRKRLTEKQRIQKDRIDSAISEFVLR